MIRPEQITVVGTPCFEKQNKIKRHQRRLYRDKPQKFELTFLVALRYVSCTESRFDLHFDFSFTKPLTTLHTLQT